MLILVIDSRGISNEIALRWMSLNLTDTGSGNGLASSGNKPLCEPMLTKIYGLTRLQWVNTSRLVYKMADILQTFSYAFLFFFKENVYILTQISLTPTDNYLSIGLCNGLVQNRQQAITTTNDDRADRKTVSTLAMQNLFLEMQNKYISSSLI